MYKVLVIDDSWVQAQMRSRIYLGVLREKFQVDFIDTGINIKENLSNSECDLILLDIVLSGMTNPVTGLELNIFDILPLIGKVKPVILVSNEYKYLLDNGKLTKIMNFIIDEGYKNVKGFLLWSEFETAVINSDSYDFISINSKILLEIERHRKELEIEKKQNFDFAVVGALESELMPFIDRIRTDGNVDKEFEENYNKFYIGRLTTTSGNVLRFIATYQCRMGMTDCSYLSSLLIHKYSVKNLFMIGVCGGRPSEGVKIGDIMIPHEAIAYQNGRLDSNKFVPDAGFCASNSGIYNVVSSEFIKQVTRNIHDSFDNLHKEKNEGKGVSIKYPNFWRDEIATGDQIVNRPNELDDIAKKVAQRKLCSVDMESYALFRASYLSGTAKGGVIKCVMDVTEEKKDEYKDYASYMAANLFFEIIYQEKLLIK